jgi:DNA-binding PadR family transcriptional regulator
LPSKVSTTAPRNASVTATSGLNIGHLCQVLDRLARDGLIESELQPQAVKPDRLVQRITPAGRAELDRWLSEPNVHTRGYRDDFFPR